MTLEEAIIHAEDTAKSAIGCECREEHRQLAEWLRELKARREADSCDGCYYDIGRRTEICETCKRMYIDNYDKGERRTDD